MQNGKNDGKRKREYRREIELDEFLMGEDGVFDDEDDDNVTDDTLEFLCLDDEMIESYQRGQAQGKTSARRSAGEAYEDEDYEDEAYDEDEDYEDEAYDEDEDYEDEE